MSKFQPALQKLLLLEGGFSNFAADPGGATNYGISLRFLKNANIVIDGHLLGDMDDDGIIDIKDIKNLTSEEAGEVYKAAWWDKYKYGTINDQEVANKIFDMSVNMGPKQAHKLVQRALNRVPTGAGELIEDGDLGKKSREILLIAVGLAAGIFLTALRTVQEEFYRNLVASNPKLRVFINGWIKRARS